VAGGAGRLAVIRAAARGWLARWRDALIGAGLAAGGVALFGRAALSGAPVPLVLLALSLAFGVWLARDGWLRARLEGDTRLGGGGPGVASVREGEIDYFGPFSGGVVDLDALESVVLSVRPGGAVWLLRAPGAAALAIPATAEGADALLDAFAALPGFDRARVARALDAAIGADVIVWRRGGGPAARALASPGARP